MRIESFLENSAARLPGKTALVAGDVRLTYQALDQACNRLAHALRALGVRRDDRVAIFLENSPDAVMAVFAVLKADAVFVMVNPTTKPSKLRMLLADCRATAVITDLRRLPAVEAVESDVPSIRAVVVAGEKDITTQPRRYALSQLIASGPDEAPVRAGLDIDLASLIYTSGSTGRPKAAMLSHLNMVTAATAITTYLQNREDDIVLNVLPLSFDYGLYQVLMAAQFSGTVVLERSFTYLHHVLEVLVRERVTGFPLVPTIAAMLLQVDVSSYDLSSLRYVTSTGAALPAAHIEQFRQLLPHARIYSMYGLTECKRVSYLPPEQLDRRPTSIGRGMPNEEVYLVDADGTRIESGIGQLVVRGSHVMQGYWERPDETARVLKPGPLPGEHVLFTGDVFRRDDEGYLYFVGRQDDIIKSRGEKVSPREIEDVLCELPGVIEAAVFGVPDDILGQAITAVIAVNAGSDLTPQTIGRHCRQHLEDFMVPHVIEICSALPKTPNGKRDVAALRASHAASSAAAALSEER